VLSADNPFYRQVTLLIELLPLVARESCFALKGGTAINLFVRDLPRLSVDIDLTYLPIKGHDESLAHIDAALRGLGSAIEECMHPWAHSVLGRIALRRQSSNNLLRAHHAQRCVDQMRPPPTELEIIAFHLQRPKELARAPKEPAMMSV
jgi:hypothetical protein